MTQTVLKSIGVFSGSDQAIFEDYTTKRMLIKNELLLTKGRVCRSVYYILSGSFYQYQPGNIDETIIDLHTENEWMYNHSSLINQTPSTTSIKAFIESEVIELSLTNLHNLIARSSAFLQFGRIFDQGNMRMYFFDNSLKPAQKYNYIKEKNRCCPCLSRLK